MGGAVKRPGLVTTWIIGAACVVTSWVGGVLLWGTPETGFNAYVPLFNLAFISIVGGAGMIVAALAVGLTTGSSTGWRAFGLAAWAAGLLLLMWPVSVIHFGGFCIDARDVCVVRWPSRILGLALGLSLVSGGAALSLLLARRSERRRGSSSFVAITEAETATGP
jgi:hypothetical protein